MIKTHLKIAWRNIVKRKGFSLINIGGLAFGMASCLLLLLYVSYHFNYDKQLEPADDIYIVENNQLGNGKIFTFATVPSQMAAAMRADVPGVDQTVRINTYTATGELLSYKENSFKKNGFFADPTFFSLLFYHFIKGNALNALSQPNSIVISKDLAKVLFGDNDPLNKVIKRNDKSLLTVTGVIDVPANSTFQFDYILPWQLFENENSWATTAGWRTNSSLTLIRLTGPTYFSTADRIIRKIINSHQKGLKAEAMLFPFSRVHLYSKFENGKSVGGLIDQIHLFVILAIFILLIACVNFMNLSTARSEERAKEVGIRKAIGSGRRLLMWQFISESVMLSFFSMLISVFLLMICLPYFNNLLNIHLLIPYDQWSVWVILICLVIVTGLISGSYPAFYLSSFKPISVLKGFYKGGKSALSVRKVLVVIQFTFAVFLITATICIYRQIRFVQDKFIGYDKNNLVEVKVEGNLDKKTDILIDELKRNNIITHATSLGLSINLSYNGGSDVSWPGKEPEQKILFDMLQVGFDFSQTTGVKLMQGREFSNQFPSDTAGKTVMINETAATVMNLKQPIGSIITYNQNAVTIIGVYKDFVWGSPYQKIPPMISSCSNSGSVIAMRLNDRMSISSCINAINTSLKTINPAYPAAINFVDTDFEKKFQNEKLLATLANLFGGLAIIISCLGLFGLAAYAAAQRIKELGIRKVLGASTANLASLLSMDFLKLVAIAIFIAIPISVWAMNKWLQQYDYHINLNWWVIALASVITIVIAVITVSFQAIKAALANPVKSLRSE